MTISTIASNVAVTTAAAVGSELDIAAKSHGQVRVIVHSLDAAKTAILQLQDTVNNFTANQPGPTIHLKGPIAAEQTFLFKKHDMANFRFGTASAELRLYAVQVDADPGLKVSCFHEA